MFVQPTIAVGATLTLQKVVSDEETLANYGTGQLENLLSTPALVALMQEASARMLDPMLPEGFITVTTMVQVEHNKPSYLGATVTLQVEVKSFDGNKVHISMQASDELGPIGSGDHIRAVVNKASLMKRVHERETLQNA